MLPAASVKYGNATCIPLCFFIAYSPTLYVTGAVSFVAGFPKAMNLSTLGEGTHCHTCHISLLVHLKEKLNTGIGWCEPQSTPIWS